MRRRIPGRLGGAVQRRQCVPEVRLILRQPRLPTLVPRVEVGAVHSAQNSNLVFNCSINCRLATIRRCKKLSGNFAPNSSRRLQNSVRVNWKRVAPRASGSNDGWRKSKINGVLPLRWQSGWPRSNERRSPILHTCTEPTRALFWITRCSNHRVVFVGQPLNYECKHSSNCGRSCRAD